jgi:hypothetical protein
MAVSGRLIIAMEPNPMVQLLRGQPSCYLPRKRNRTMKHTLPYLAAAAAIAVTVWAITGAPLPSHPDSYFAQNAGRH